MKGVSVQGLNKEGVGMKPDEATRKRVAVELIRNHDRPLRWTARRYSMCPEDAEDAYQRGVEILLAKAPSSDPNHLLPWARTVIKHEALAIKKTRERTLGQPLGINNDDGAIDDWVQLIPALEDGPDDLAIRRERVARSREALSLLKPAELKALTQLAEGFSYQEIGEMNNWTRTKVNRCLAEGRARFRSAFHDSESGDRCPDFEAELSASCDGQLSGEQQKKLEIHLAACGCCRSTLRTYRAAPRAAAALSPVIPASRSFWERTQELVVDLQVRLQGIGGGAETGVQSVVTSGGTRGLGVAALAKLAAICAGTAGTAAVCAATGVVPGAALLPDSKPAVEKSTEVPNEASTTGLLLGPPETTNPMPPGSSTSRVIKEKRVTRRAEVKREQQSQEAPSVPDAGAPPPVSAQTQAEFTPESAGTPAPEPAAPPAAAAPATAPKPTSSSVPVGNGGGEFAP